MGGCSYGELDPRQYPYYNVIAMHPDSQVLKGLKTYGCGACFEIQCIDEEAVSESLRAVISCNVPPSNVQSCPQI